MLVLSFYSAHAGINNYKYLKPINIHLSRFKFFRIAFMILTDYLMSSYQNFYKAELRRSQKNPAALSPCRRPPPSPIPTGFKSTALYQNTTASYGQRLEDAKALCFVSKFRNGS